MSFASREESRFNGEPINLYLFRYGDQPSEALAYTDAEEAVIHLGVTFEPVPIDRTKLTASGTLDKSNVTVSTPQDSALAKLYLIYPPSSVTTVVMYQGHLDDEYKVVWTGRVVGCARKGSRAEFTCEPVSTSLRRNGLRRRFQFGCPHVLYGDQCRASKSAATTTATLTAINGSRITFPIGWSSIAVKYAGGLVEWTADSGSREIRTVLNVENDGATLLLAGSIAGLRVGMTVNVVLGCNHKLGHGPQPDGDCGPLHNNAQNFGGMPYIPFKNPLSFGTNQYYGG